MDTGEKPKQWSRLTRAMTLDQYRIRTLNTFTLINPPNGNDPLTNLRYNNLQPSL